MNHSCAVIGVTANVTQWTPPSVGQTDGQTDGHTESSTLYPSASWGITWERVAVPGFVELMITFVVVSNVLFDTV